MKRLIVLIFLFSWIPLIILGCAGGESNTITTVGPSGIPTPTSSPTVSPTITPTPSPSSTVDPNCVHHVDSPGGTVATGSKAYFADCEYYVCEIEPYYKGNFAIYQVEKDGRDVLVQQWQIDPDFSNDLKGIACNIYTEEEVMEFAVTYHYGNGHVYIFRYGYANAVAFFTYNKGYHFMQYYDVDSLQFKETPDGQVDIIDIIYN